ncbi:MAG: RNA-binding protein [Spirochaetia bacterium]|nr:RNA-binding protein [Spirochaetia bacterium]
MNIYVGNLNYATTEEELNSLFAQHGNVVSVNIIYDKYSGRAKGFGFVEMENKDEAMKAISELNDKEFNGRNIRVNEAKPREEKKRNGREDFRRR